tara:strand:+ start:330100 stop:330570 length:471 start_codon:yes stop_codon:yes gene_type:complete
VKRFEMNYFLCGFSGAGKSQYLKELSNSEQYKNYQFYDLDDYIFSSLTGYSGLGEAIEDKGWEWFRSTEQSKLMELLNRENVWVALGGGTLTQDLVKKLKSYENIKGFWLNTDFETCWSRIEGDTNRPLVKKGKQALRELYLEREPLYKNFEKVLP